MSSITEAVLPESTLWERVHSALQTNPYCDEQHVHFVTRRGEVTLRGNVESYFQKQMAQEAILRVDGVERVDNLLEVDWKMNGSRRTTAERRCRFC
jgi:osmotically-inducible protein OsmY